VARSVSGGGKEETPPVVHVPPPQSAPPLLTDVLVALVDVLPGAVDEPDVLGLHIIEGHLEVLLLVDLHLRLFLRPIL
jgi:hypothetical protein